VDDRAKKQQHGQFTEQITKMIDGPVYSLSSWSAELDEAMGSWKMMMPGAKSQPEVQKMQAIRDIIAKMSIGQKSNPKALLRNEVALAELATESGTSPMDVRMMLQRFEGLKTYQTWVRKRKMAGRRMPKSMDEMAALCQVDLEKDNMKKMRSRARRF
jgi:signal recognition particle GTPase